MVVHVGQLPLVERQAREGHVAIDGTEGSNVFRLGALEAEISIHFLHGIRRRKEKASRSRLDLPRDCLRHVEGRGEEPSVVKDSTRNLLTGTGLGDFYEVVEVLLALCATAHGCPVLDSGYPIRDFPIQNRLDNPFVTRNRQGFDGGALASPPSQGTKVIEEIGDHLTVG